MGAALAALVLTVLTFGPGLDTLICHDEGGLPAAAAEVPVGDVASDDSPASHPDDGAGVCIHGHCHHPTPYVAATHAADPAPSVADGRHEWLRVTMPASDLKFGLKRPPRA